MDGEEERIGESVGRLPGVTTMVMVRPWRVESRWQRSRRGSICPCAGKGITRRWGITAPAIRSGLCSDSFPSMVILLQAKTDL
ncbi:hypothetical protein M5K25_005997 [Dendrobium thyrsiflorum]|uniref:Uncharacterized protein n=1 Tax=Dendrobium thyrsiflorum TaxID=117978 RepID=A0ABD0VA95_DENTH